MTTTSHTKKYTCFLFGEGDKDRKFLISLISLKKFKYHTQKWNFNFSNGIGGSAKDILERCRKEIQSSDYDLVICLIDLDDLKNSYPKKWELKKEELEKKYSEIIIIWQLDNAEEEYKKVIGKLNVSKFKLNKLARENIDAFVNTDFYMRLLKPIKEKEQFLKENNF